MVGPANALNITQPGYVVFDGTSVFTGRTFQAGTGITLTNASGVAGNTTISATGSADGGAVIPFVTSNGGNSFNDSTTYYIPVDPGNINVSLSVGPYSKIWMPRTGTITGLSGALTVGGALSSSENSTLIIRKNDTSNTTVTSTLQSSAVTNTFSVTGLSVPVVAGDYISILWVTAAWATNPTNVIFNFSIALT